MMKAFSFLLLSAVLAHAEMRVVTDFEGGNAEVVTLDQAAGRLRIMPALHEGRGWPCWWSLKLDGVTAGQEITLEVQVQTKPFRPGNVLSASWCQPDQAVLSHDGKTWLQTAKAERTAEKVAVYKVKAEGPSLWLAWGPPFVPSIAEEVLSQVKARLGDEAERFELAKTLGGRPVNGIRIGKVDAPRQVWVGARQHAWEAGGAWVGRGFIEWIASDAAKDFR
ncbi:MAG TPA: M14-type cytosolic carboxypeptidase, partial [Prosthecobacter sp.]